MLKVLLRIPQVFWFLAYFLWEMLLANLRLAYDILTPKHFMHPGILAVPLDATTDTEITLLANLISLTPGTLSLDVSSDRKVLYIHAMYVGEIQTFKDFEQRLLKVMR